MAGLRPQLARRHFLASTIIGSVGLFLPLTAAHASTSPPPGPGAQTLSPAPSPTTNPTGAVTGESSIIGTAANFQPVGDISIRPFHYHATNEELADLKRRVKATKWPDRETVNDDTQGVRLETMQKLVDYWANSTTGDALRTTSFLIRTLSPTSMASTSTSSM